jgi:hypothetical protein
MRLLNAGSVGVANAVLWGNAAPLGPEVYVAAGAGPSIERAVIGGGCPSSSTCAAVLDQDPLFVRAPDPGPDRTWGTADDDYGDLRVQAGSPALDFGLTSLLPPDVWDLDGDGDTAEPLPIDVAGQARVRGPEVDLGAYERGSPWRATSRAGAASEVAALGLDVRPNPARGSVAVTVWLPSVGEATVGIYDVLGRRVALLHAGVLAAGRHRFVLDGGTLPAGVYVVRVTDGRVVETARVTVVRGGG